ncbi:uncharacterized protein V1513DRAFT_448893 [Lipomyces chichibuensis]|uniref:uncharacterized protein n=1 Tax=Lipomyces chichibuensis TaxID=1546026 RepID=UPI003343DC04
MQQQHPIYALLSLVNSPAAAVDFVTRATSAPDLFTFAYLLHSPALTQHLREGDQTKKYIELLRLFASGTWQDYIANQSSMPALTDAQTIKLKQLSLISLASESHTLPYSTLLSELSLPDMRALASLVVSCIYANLISATLDTREELVHVSAVIAGRDVVDKPDISRLKSVIDTWASRCAETIEDLNNEARKVREKAVQESKDIKEYNRTVEMVNKQLMAPSGKDSGKDTPSAEDGAGEAMDIDETSPMSDSSISTKKRKQRTAS